MTYTEFVKKAANTDVTREDLSSWLSSARGKELMKKVSPQELAAYAAGAGLGGVGGYALHRLINRHQPGRSGLMWALIGAGLGGAGTFAYVNTYKDPNTGLTGRDRFRISNAYQTDPKFQKLYDKLQQKRYDAARSAGRVALDWGTNVAGAGAGAGAGFGLGRFFTRQSAEAAESNANAAAGRALAKAERGANAADSANKARKSLMRHFSTDVQPFVKHPEKDVRVVSPAFGKAVGRNVLRRGGRWGAIFGLLSGLGLQHMIDW